MCVDYHVYGSCLTVRSDISKFSLLFKGFIAYVVPPHGSCCVSRQRCAAHEGEKHAPVSSTAP